MDYFFNQRKDYGYYDQPTHPTGQTMANAALVLGIIALATFWTIYLPLVFGGLGIIFAYLSKGFQPKLTGYAKAGFSFSAVSFFISLVVIIASLIYALNNPAVLMDYARRFDQNMLQVYGQSTEAVMGTSYEITMQQLLDFLGIN
jgi:ABC-type spermidine/putrescine transport system permease subunit I